MDNTSGLKGEPESVASDKAPIDRAAVERKAQELSGPELWGSDPTWDGIGFYAGLFLLLLPVRKHVQALARKYHQRPEAFWRAFKRLCERHIHKVAKNPEWRSHLRLLALYQQRVMEAAGRGPQGQTEYPLTLPQGLPQKKLGALDQILTILTPALTRLRIPDADARNLFSAMKTLAGRPAGAKRKGLLDVAKKLSDSGKYRGRDAVHRICFELERQARRHELEIKSDDPILQYSDLAARDQNYVRQRIRSGILRRKKQTE